MKLPLPWICEHLGISQDEEEIDKNLVKLGMEVEGIEDSVIEISIPANRGDCLSLEGLTRELANSYSMQAKPIDTPDVDVDFESGVKVKIDASDKCAKYIAKSFSGVNNRAKTPDWMKTVLEAAGMQSLSPVVDITNYVMIEMGQPLHAFDSNKISGNSIVIRTAKKGESLELLDGRNEVLSEEDLVIADSEKVLAVAGIMGGEESSISEETTNVVLECAWFEPVGVRLSSRAHKLQTDSSYRFERGVDFNLQERAVNRAAKLIKEICGASVGSQISKTLTEKLPARSALEFRLEKAESILGFDLSGTDISKLFFNLKMDVEKISDTTWKVTPPSHRFDIEIEEDLIEEVARVISYDSIDYAMPSVKANIEFRRANKKVEELHLLKKYMMGLGFSEVISYSFISPAYAEAFDILESAHRVVNPISEDLSVMRSSLWPSLVKIADYNKNRQEKRLKIYEVGRKFENLDGKVIETEFLSGLIWGGSCPVQWAQPSNSFDFFDVKGDVEKLLSNAGISDAKFESFDSNMLHPGQSAKIIVNGNHVGALGQLHPQIAKQLSIPSGVFLFEILTELLLDKATPSYQRVSKFPSVKRDLNVLVDELTPSTEVRRLIFASAGTILKDVNVVDRYCGNGVPKGKVSLSFSLVYQDAAKTLKDEDIDSSVQNVLDSLKKDLGVLLREYDDTN